MQGSVKWFDEKRGFGFIIADDGRDVFVHYKAITDQPRGQKNLKEGQRVDFRIEHDERGPKAANVQSVHDVPASCPQKSPIGNHQS